MADFADREKFERALRVALGKVYSPTPAELARRLGDPPNADNVPPAFWKTLQARMGGEIQDLLEQVYLNAARQLGSDAPIGVGWALVNKAAASWAKDYTYDLVKGITDTARDRLRDVVGRYYEEGLTQGDLRGLIAPLFGPTRAAMIAQTEVTRASVQGEMAIAAQVAEAGIPMVALWQTNVDDLVCPICGPLDGRARGDGWSEPPPAHVNCRCWVSYDFEKAASETQTPSVVGFSPNQATLGNVADARAAGSALYTDAEKAFGDMLDSHGVTDDVTRTLGLWGGPEPSFNAAVTGSRDDVFALAKEWGKTYNQEAVALLVPNADGTGGRQVWDFGRNLTDAELNSVLGGLQQVNALLPDDQKVGLTVKDGSLEYWYRDKDNLALANNSILQALELSGLDSLPTGDTVGGYSLALLFRGVNY